ncbi:PREDICTED: spore coat protein SP96-like [Eufriesea mexicana]|uniref:spore coat protein SP96-like n=1 Tax=Eufriesea mexicana TaxID=516756 RepID=UPI00083C665D|nr:PREDICTED: spore coat protein SP96-like [Eufriesea mexicana]
MEPKCVVFMCTTLFALLLLITGIRPQNFDDRETIDGNNHKGCAYMHCEGNDVCVHRKFRCKDPPCPSMLFCAKSRTESIKGPSTCDNVQCTNGYVCMLKVRRCHWDAKCEQQIARCVSRKEYHEGPASCAGFKCPRGNHCILRESFCASPPCKLLRSCGKNKEVNLWFGRCRNLGCPSEYQCFLRRPENNCTNPPCKHTPDCIITRENEVTNEHCRGWMCPRMQTCAAEILGTCEANECNIKRTCHEVHVIAANDSSSFSRRSLKNKDEIPGTDTEVPLLP